jgi:predicted ribosome quality control (RQC) complex YloA/Tae2 family protein
MKVVEKDRVISGMLRDELKRCQEMLDSLEKSVSELPKGVINERRKRYKDKVYSYYYLKYREGKKVVNKHISNKDMQEISKKLEVRRKYEKEIQSYKKKIAYLNKIVDTGKRRSHANIATVFQHCPTA